MSLSQLPIRLAAAVPTLQEEESLTPEEPSIPGPSRGAGHGSGLGLLSGDGQPQPGLPGPLNVENGENGSNFHSSDALAFGSASDLFVDGGAVSSNHQFWLKDAKIAEDLFTIHRSAKHLVEFVRTCRRELTPRQLSLRQIDLLTSSMIGSHDPSLGHRPIPVMSDADVLFMTQLSNDIARGVGGISAVRHHGLRTRKRKARDAIVSGRAAEAKAAKAQASHRRQSKGERDDRTTASKRLQVSKDEQELSCCRCGRTETPEWRKGPEGLLCNVCGLVYAKQRRKLKSTS